MATKRSGTTFRGVKRTVICPICKRAYQTYWARTCGRTKCREELQMRQWENEQNIINGQTTMPGFE